MKYNAIIKSDLAEPQCISFTVCGGWSQIAIEEGIVKEDSPIENRLTAGALIGVRNGWIPKIKDCVFEQTSAGANFIEMEIVVNDITIAAFSFDKKYLANGKDYKDNTDDESWEDYTDDETWRESL